MSPYHWFLLGGGLLLATALTAPLIDRLPITRAMLYLAVGTAIGPTALHAFHFNPLKEADLLEVISETAVVLSLFSAGMKMPVPVSLRRWRSPLLLASLGMLLTIALVALFARHALDLPWGAAVLLGAILAPTDPVLATEIQVRHPGDRDRLRFGLSCEAGVNDGTAFPFVMLGLGLLGLHDLGDLGLAWAVRDLLWASLMGVAIGVTGGLAVAHLLRLHRRAWPDAAVMEDFLGLGLIGVVYGLSLAVGAWGFLAVFFSAVALRQGELGMEERTGGDRFTAPESTGAGAARRVSETSLVFKEQLARLSEVILVILVGGTLFVDSWSWRALGTALFVFFVARPLGVFLSLAWTRAPQPMRALVGWFGVRGIGSLYYLMFAIEQGLPEDLALELIHLTLIVITLSIVLHGISVKPLLRRYWRARNDPRATTVPLTRSSC